MHNKPEPDKIVLICSICRKKNRVSIQRINEALCGGCASNLLLGNQAKSELPIKGWLNETFKDFFDFLGFWKLRKKILRDPRIVNKVIKSKGNSPYKFAIQGVLFLAVVSSIINWSIDNFLRLPPLPIEVRIDQAKEAMALKSKYHGYSLEDLEKAKRLGDFANNLKPVEFGLSFLLNATLLSYLLKKGRGQFTGVEDAGSVYLYYVSSRLFLPYIAIYVVGIVFTILFRYEHEDYSNLVSYVVVGHGDYSNYGVNFYHNVLIGLCSLWALITLRYSVSTMGYLFGFRGDSAMLQSRREYRYIANRLGSSIILSNLISFVVFFMLGVLYVLLARPKVN